MISISPLLIIILVNSYIIYNNFNSRISDEIGNPWKTVLGGPIFQFLYLFYPIIISIIVYAFCEVENKNNNFKTLFTLPVSRFNIFFNKVLILFLYLLFSIIAFYFFFLLSGFFLNLFYPSYGFQNYEYGKVIFFVFLKLYISLLAISMVQYSLSLIFRNFIFPIGFSIFMLVVSLAAANSEISDYIPFSGGYKSYENIMSENIKFNLCEYVNIFLIIIFFFINKSLFTKRNIFL